MSKQDPSTLTYILTSIFAIIVVALFFGLFQAILSTTIGRCVVSLFLATILALPLASAVQDGVLWYNKERHDKQHPA